MVEVIRFIFGIGGMLVLFGVYAYLSVTAFAKARKQEIEKDKAEFGHCCGLENGICTFQPKLDKLNKIDLEKDAAKKE